MTFMVPIQAAYIPTLLALLQRPITTVVLAAVRGTSAFTFSFGALLVNGAAQLARATTAAFASPHYIVRILFSGAALSGAQRPFEVKLEP